MYKKLQIINEMGMKTLKNYCKKNNPQIPFNYSIFKINSEELLNQVTVMPYETAKDFAEAFDYLEGNGDIKLGYNCLRYSGDNYGYNEEVARVIKDVDYKLTNKFLDHLKKYMVWEILKENDLKSIKELKNHLEQKEYDYTNSQQNEILEYAKKELIKSYTEKIDKEIRGKEAKGTKNIKQENSKEIEK